MAKNSVDAYGAKGKGNLLDFDPDDLTLVTDETHPLYDERVHWPLDEAMVRNIDFQGIIQPIEVTKNPETGATEVVTGRQRVKNCREANRRRRERGEKPWLIPAFVRRIAPKDRSKKLSAAIASENAIRQQETPMTRAAKMARQLGHHTEEEVAILFGCKVATVRSTLALLDCCAEVQKAVDSGKVPVTHAAKLARMKPDQQREKVRDLIDAANSNTGHARARAQREVMGDASPRLKTRKQIADELSKCDGERAEALRWVLGITNTNH
ncbi:ParB/RepB/Spo0J family partition protein [Burkholderia sp. AU32262]|uniref:ParB/RepB/Spo0J family partition protein n=1 Tax=Burkholderia sp. AU32262 TaxID=2879630 RepID=UPI001CF269AD|nr:hypothetical protein [Burkholderia sp. AU32262]MCA8240610.1 hypothetical protein [Burkholderia sp. AU32262]HDR9034424.1 hypothetical protein [Burkholderia vietnamiensis]